MFGLTRLTPEEKVEHARTKRVNDLNNLIAGEAALRAKSLEKAVEFTKERDVLTAKKGVL